MLFGKKVQSGYDHREAGTEIVMEDGDQEIGEIIYHPANVDPYSVEKTQDSSDDERDYDSMISDHDGDFDPAYQEKIDEMEDSKENFDDEWAVFDELYEHGDSNEPTPRLVLDDTFKSYLMEQTKALNDDFLVNARFMFAEYLGLT